MKRTIFALATLLVVIVAVLAVGALRPVRKVKANQGCTNGSLRGTYQLVMDGAFDTNDFEGDYGPFTWDFSMVANFDGEGNVSGSNLVGVISGEGTGPVSFSGGTYTVNSDCTVQITFPDTISVFDDYAVSLTGAVTEGSEVMGIGAFGVYETYPWTGTFDGTKVEEWGESL